MPPVSPETGNLLKVIFRSLKLQTWILLVDKGDPSSIDTLIFVKYYDPDTNLRLTHSLGLNKGLIYVVNASTDVRHAGNDNVVITYELQHTVGAGDKYDVHGEPVWPVG